MTLLCLSYRVVLMNVLQSLKSWCSGSCIHILLYSMHPTIASVNNVTEPAVPVQMAGSTSVRNMISSSSKLQRVSWARDTLTQQMVILLYIAHPLKCIYDVIQIGWCNVCNNLHYMSFVLQCLLWTPVSTCLCGWVRMPHPTRREEDLPLHTWVHVND